MTVMPSNSTGVNGDPGTGGGSTGWTSAVTFTLTVSLRVPSCGSTTSITHSGSPVILSTCWTTTSPLDLSKSRTFSNAPTAYAPAGNTTPDSTGNGPSIAGIGISCLCTSRLTACTIRVPGQNGP